MCSMHLGAQANGNRRQCLNQKSIYECVDKHNSVFEFRTQNRTKAKQFRE